jgi:hypothetical protein
MAKRKPIVRADTQTVYCACGGNSLHERKVLGAGHRPNLGPKPGDRFKEARLARFAHLALLLKATNGHLFGASSILSWILQLPVELLEIACQFQPSFGKGRQP